MIFDKQKLDKAIISVTESRIDEGSQHAIELAELLSKRLHSLGAQSLTRQSFNDIAALSQACDAAESIFMSLNAGKFESSVKPGK
jgi:hypothetical protein